jgi:hypothetical protein
MPRQLRMTEAQEQSQIFQWASFAMNEFPELYFLHHVPNGGSRHPIEAVNLRRQGVKRGVPDIFLDCARGGYHGLRIELKTQHGKLSPEQCTWLQHLRAEGYRAECAFGAEQAIYIIKQYLIGREQ